MKPINLIQKYPSIRGVVVLLVLSFILLGVAVSDAATARNRIEQAINDRPVTLFSVWNSGGCGEFSIHGGAARPFVFKDGALVETDVQSASNPSGKYSVEAEVRIWQSCMSTHQSYIYFERPLMIVSVYLSNKLR